MKNEKFVQDLQKQIFQYMTQEFSEIILLCIGTNQLIGDCIGPMVGELLNQETKKENIIIYGNMIETINFKNARKTIEYILKKYKKPFIITVDSALGTEKMIKRIVVSRGMIKIGKSLGRSISYYSHINIKGVVGENKNTVFENIQTLKTVKPEIIVELSNQMVTGIKKMIETIRIAN